MIILVLLIVGLAAGSFVNALVWRLYEQSKAKKSRSDLSIISGRSMCPNCRHTLRSADLIPVLSWISLRGKCRYCHKPISWQYPLVELLTASLFIVSFWLWPFGWAAAGIVAFGLWLLCLVMLVALAVYDIHWMLLPNRLVYPLMGLSFALAALLSLAKADLYQFGMALLGGLALSGLFWLLFQLSGGCWIGGGDVKLAVALGLIAGGILPSILLLFIASLFGSLVAVPLLVQGRKLTSRVPFGPFLIAATVIVFWWGAAMINWYSQLLTV